ncbi:MAG: DUF368 domain-containing protein [Myxococcota bacterium]
MQTATTSNAEPRPSSVSSYLMVFLRGVAMGAADVVPGVSGGTVAFITGIYEELLDAIKAFGGEGLKRAWARDLRGAWRAVNGNFLVALAAGIAASIVTLSRGVLFALETYPELLWAFFVGLLVGAIWVVSRQVTRWRPQVIGAGLAGGGFAFAVVSATPSETPESLPFVFLTGVVGISAMILPGISGSFILVLFGKYEFILGAVKAAQLDVLAAFAAGCGLGLLGFSHALAWLFRRYHDATVAAITGFLIGSMPKIWPWKHTLETYVDRHGVTKPLVQENVSPFAYAALTGRDAVLVGALIAAALGLVLVLGLDRLAGKRVNLQT